MQHIHWLGTGLSSIPGIRRLAQNYDYLTIWNRTIEKAEQSINHVNKQNVVAKKFDIDSLSQILKAGDIVVSQLPANQHVDIAKLCLIKKCHFATSSYISPDMQSLDGDAKKNNLVFVNEVGLDPGIDHFFSHLLVKKLKDMNLTNLDVTYHSYCWGFPAIPNDFKYKFSWSPLGVLKALKSPSKSLRNFKEFNVDRPWDAISSYQAPLEKAETFEVYPNRDSLPFMEDYKFDPAWIVKDFVRGTLRLNGWSLAWQDIFKEIERLTGKAGDNRLKEMSDQFWSENAYEKDEPDRVVLCVSLKAEMKNSIEWHKTFVMDAWGNDEGSAMSRLVSQPVSLAVEAVLHKKLEAGVQAAPSKMAIVDDWLSKIDNLAQYLKVIQHN